MKTNIFGKIPIRVYDPLRLVEEMKVAPEGTIFVLDSSTTKNPEGRDSTVEMTFARIYRTRDSSAKKVGSDDLSRAKTAPTES